MSSTLPHVRDPVTGRCIACDAINNGTGVFVSKVHNDEPSYQKSNSKKTWQKAGNVMTLAVPQKNMRPGTPVVFNPQDPNYIRSIRAGNITLNEGQGIYYHSGTPRHFQNHNNDSNVVINNRQTVIETQPRFITGVAPPVNIHGATYYPGERDRHQSVDSLEGGGCFSCCDSGTEDGGCRGCIGRGNSTRKQPRRVAPADSAVDNTDNVISNRENVWNRNASVKRSYWSDPGDDPKSRCRKSCCLVLLAILLAALVVAIIIGVIYGRESYQQTVPLYRRYIVVYNDTLCQTTGTLTTAANCAFTLAPVLAPADFANPSNTLILSSCTISIHKILFWAALFVCISLAMV